MMDSNTFAYHPPTPAQLEALQKVQTAYNAALAVIEENTPPSRYLDMAIADLEKSGAMAVKGIFKKSDGSPVVE
jgi:hypothetical protein